MIIRERPFYKIGGIKGMTSTMNAKGLSFVSMLVALLVIGMLLAVLLPQFKTTVQTQHATQQHALQQAQHVQQQLNALQQARQSSLENLEGTHP